MYELHECRVGGGASAPYLHHRVIIAVHQQLFPRPLGTPGRCRHQNRKQFLPLDAGAALGPGPGPAEPVARPVRTIAMVTGTAGRLEMVSSCYRGKNSCHSTAVRTGSTGGCRLSSLALGEYGRLTRVLASMRRRIKILPAGIAFAANASFPIRDRSARFWHFLRIEKAPRSSSKATSFSCGRLATWEMVSSCTPRNVIEVVGGVRFSGLVATPSCWHRCSILLNESAHVVECGGPATRKSSR